MKYSAVGRALAILSAIGMPVVAIWQFVNDPTTVPLGVYCAAIAVLVGIIEVPFICSCFTWCQVLARYSRPVVGYWFVRAGLYIGMSAGGYAIYQLQTKNTWLLVSIVVLTLAAALYIVATVLREPSPAYDADSAASKASAAKETRPAPAASSSSSSSSNGATAGLWGMFGGSKAQTAAIAAGTAAAAESMFPRDPEAAASAHAPASAPGAAVAATKPAASLFSGGALFGGGGSKYGYAADTPEANPFVS